MSLFSSCGCQDESQERKTGFFWTVDREKKAARGIANGSYSLSTVSFDRIKQEQSSDEEKTAHETNTSNISTISSQIINGSANGLYRKVDPDKIELGITNGGVVGFNSELFRNSGAELCDVSDKKEGKSKGRFRSTLSQVKKYSIYVILYKNILSQ